MKHYDVIIIGGGPAGLKCAETLKDSKLSVLLLEKEPVFGDKLCAGGLTTNDLKILHLPDKVIEHKISDTAMQSRNRKSYTQAMAPFLYTVDRKELGIWQRGLLNNSSVTVRENARVVKIDQESVTLKEGTSFGYTYLVGADGHASLVRKYLRIPVRKKLVGIQYTIPQAFVQPQLEIHLDAKLFKAWYAWIFPHRDSIAVGCCSDPRALPPAELSRNFHIWLKRKNIDHSDARLRSYPINYDYKGIRFDHTYLVGEAAGMASGLTGEGIYQSLVSGQEAARMILDPEYISEPLQKVLKYNAIQNRIMRIFNSSELLRSGIHELLLMAMNSNTIKKFIRSFFSPAKANNT